MISNNRTSHLISSQVPFFVRNDHPNFVTFLEKYYEYLEQNSKVMNRAKNVLNYQNIDLTEDEFAERLCAIFMPLIPKNIATDKKVLVKHIKDFYRARGTERSIRFLLSAVHDVQEVNFYYPQKDILRASDGKWFIQRSVRIDDIRIDGLLTSVDDPLILEKFIGIKITAQTSGTTAIVERVDRFYEESSLIQELIVSNIDGKFKNSEVIKGEYSDGENVREITAVVYNFVIDQLKILEQGTFYNVGDPVIIRSNTGNGAFVTVGSVSRGEITEIIAIDGGSGYKAGDNLRFIGETFGGAAPARANVLSVVDDNLVHPNTYTLDDTQIALVANNIIGNTSVYEPYSYSPLATQLQTRPAQTSNLIISTSNITSLLYYSNRLFRANVRIANNGPILVNNQYSLITSYNTINDYVTIYPGFVGNVSGYPIETLSIRKFTNLYVNVSTGISSTGSISLLQANNLPIRSNISVESIDTANVIVFDAWKANSNVFFTTGTQIIVNGSNLIVTSSSPNRNWIRTTPAITGNIDNTHLIVWQAKYERANVENSNIYFGIANTLSINQVNTFVTLADQSSNVINVFPEITIDPTKGLNLYPIRVFTSVSNVGNVRITNAYAHTITLNEFAANSNVFFRSGDYLNVNGSLALVNSYNLISNTIVLSPGLQDANTTFDHFVVNRTPFNSTSNLTLNTGSSSTNTVNLNYLVSREHSNVKVGRAEFDTIFEFSRPTIYLTEWLANSNIAISNGSVLAVNGQTIIVTGSNGASQNVLYVSAPVSENLWSNDIIVLTYAESLKNVSNVFFETGDGLIVNGTTVFIESSNAINSTIRVSPALNGGLLHAPFDVIKKPNVNTVIANSLIYFTYEPTGPIGTIRLISGGSYLRVPDIQAEGNSKIFQYGILGSLEITDPGFSYTIGDVITFTNQLGGTGGGALAEVLNVNTSGSITEVRFKQVDQQTIGGSGYSINFLPVANVVSATGSNGKITVKSILGSGAKFQAKANKVGGIRSLIIRSRGSGYEDAFADLTANGDGLAVVNVSVVAGDIFGVYAYPGRWLNDDGQLSSPNYLQDRDYYQTFSYVIKTDESIENYRKVVKDLVHPAGTNLFGEHMRLDQAANTICPCNVETALFMTSTLKSYEKTGNTINISYQEHSLDVGNTVYLEFSSGGNTNVKNGIYSVLTTLPNYFTVRQYSPINSIIITNPGENYNANSYLVITGDGKNANGTFTINANGSIVSVSITDQGALYTQSPTTTANGSNGIMATFTTIIKYANNTNGNVFVSIVR